MEPVIKFYTKIYIIKKKLMENFSKVTEVRFNALSIRVLQNFFNKAMSVFIFCKFGHGILIIHYIIE